MSVTCHHCGGAAELVNGEVIYPHRPDLARLHFWRCAPCNAYVGCHAKGAVADGVKSDGTLPLGRLASEMERAWRSRAHAAFDPLWKTGRLTRSSAYELLSIQMKMKKEDCHIGNFTVKQCVQVIAAVEHIHDSLRKP